MPRGGRPFPHRGSRHMSDSAKYCVGIDFGGTNTKFCLLDGRSRPAGIFQLRTARSRQDIVDQMVNGVRKAMADQAVPADQVLGVGIGSPGPLDLAKGTILATPNIPGLENLPIRDLVSAGLGLPCVLENDANAAAYGEYICGAGREARDMVLLTLGTGIGSGIVIDGKVLHGSHNIGAELGHMLVEPNGEPCGCGQRGCLERYCSATYLAQRATRLIREEAGKGCWRPSLASPAVSPPRTFSMPRLPETGWPGKSGTGEPTSWRWRAWTYAGYSTRTRSCWPAGWPTPASTC